MNKPERKCNVLQSALAYCCLTIIIACGIVTACSNDESYAEPPTEAELQRTVDRANADAIMEAHRLDTWERRNEYDLRMVEFLALDNPTDTQRYAFVQFAEAHLDWMYRHGYVDAAKKRQLNLAIAML